MRYHKYGILSGCLTCASQALKKIITKYFSLAWKYKLLNYFFNFIKAAYKSYSQSTFMPYFYDNKYIRQYDLVLVNNISSYTLHLFFRK